LNLKRSESLRLDKLFNAAALSLKLPADNQRVNNVKMPPFLFFTYR
jgi:hypothetical protein